MNGETTEFVSSNCIQFVSTLERRLNAFATIDCSRTPFCSNTTRLVHSVVMRIAHVLRRNGQRHHPCARSIYTEFPIRVCVSTRSRFVIQMSYELRSAYAVHTNTTTKWMEEKSGAKFRYIFGAPCQIEWNNAKCEFIIISFVDCDAHSEQRESRETTTMIRKGDVSIRWSCPNRSLRER